MSQRDKRRLPVAALLIMSLYAPAQWANAGEDVRILLEILLEKGIITQEEFDQKLRKAQEKEDIRAFNESQDIRRANREIDKRAEEERKFKTQFYGQLSSGYYSASNMTSNLLDASGMSDQPKSNNRAGVKFTREINSDVTAVVTLESNFSLRTGAVGRDAAAYGSSSSSGLGGALLDREASLRVNSTKYGTLILGRAPTLQNDLSSAFDARSNWNFGGLKPIARYAGFHSASGVNRADKLVRYTSPVFEGFSADVAISLGGAPGFEEYGTSTQVGGRYKRGNFEAGYNHIEARLGGTSQKDVNNRVDFFAVKYNWDQLTLNAGYVVTRNPSGTAGTFDTSKTAGKVDADTWFAGALYRFTPQISWNGGWYQVRDKTLQTSSNQNNDVRMLATGLTWTPYKEWDLFVDYAQSMRESGATGAFTIYDKWVPDTSVGGVAGGYSESKRNQSGISIGAQYKF
jgi:predicted porin